MTNTVSYSSSSFEEVGNLVNKIASVVDIEDENIINAACLAIVVHNNRPEWDARKVAEALKSISEWIALYLSEPEMKVN